MQLRTAFTCVLTLLTTSFSTLHAQDWLSLDERPNQRGQKPSIELLESSPRGLRVRVRFRGIWQNTASQGRARFTRFRLPGGGRIIREGYPELPQLSLRVGAPRNAQVRLQIEQASRRSLPLTRAKPWPVQSPISDEVGSKKPPFVQNAAAYRSQQPYPARSVQLRKQGSSRGVDLYRIRIAPLRWTPATGRMSRLREIVLRITFSGGDRHFDDAIRFARQTNANGFFRTLLNESTIRERLTPIPLEDRFALSGCDYLIIVHPCQREAADKLADLKRSRGLVTRVATIEETGSTAGEIEAYIDELVAESDNPPAYLCILGDANLVPTVYRMPHPYSYKGTGFDHTDTNPCVGSDHAYACVDGPGDFEQDLWYGRLPASTLDEAHAMVDKIIEYTNSPPSDPLFYRNVTLAAYFQDVDDDDPEDGRAARRFTQTSEEIRDLWRDRGKTVRRIYCTERDHDPQEYADGTPIPATLLRSSGFAWDGDAADITDAVEGGTFLLHHRDHGWRGGWGDPAYGTAHADLLNNRGQYPVVFSINCSTGHFDDETDQDEYNSAGDSFAEHLLENTDRGAVAVIAATRVSYSGYNDVLALSMQETILDGTLRLGQVLHEGKIAMERAYSGWSKTNLEKEIFQLFGDPEMQIRTTVPLVKKRISRNLFAQRGALLPLTVGIGSRLVLRVDGRPIRELVSNRPKVWIRVPRNGKRVQLSIHRRGSLPEHRIIRRNK